MMLSFEVRKGLDSVLMKERQAPSFIHTNPCFDEGKMLVENVFLSSHEFTPRKCTKNPRSMDLSQENP